MKRAKTALQTAKNASKLHKHVGRLLSELFPNYEVRQEYSVSRVNPGFASNREKFDWAVLGLNIIVEIHGQQHYRPVCFGGITLDEAKAIFRRRQDKDEEKQEAASKAGWAYLVVKYTEKDISLEELSTRVSQAIKDASPAEEIVPAKPKAKIQNRGFQQRAEYRQKILSRPFQKPKGGYKWPTRKIPTRRRPSSIPPAV